MQMTSAAVFPPGGGGFYLFWEVDSFFNHLIRVSMAIFVRFNFNAIRKRDKPFSIPAFKAASSSGDHGGDLRLFISNDLVLRLARQWPASDFLLHYGEISQLPRRASISQRSSPSLRRSHAWKSGGPPLHWSTGCSIAQAFRIL